MKNVTEVTLSRQELEHLRHVLRIYGLTGQYIGVQRLFMRRQGVLLAKIEDAMTRTKALPRERPNADRVARAQARKIIDYDYVMIDQTSL